MLSASRIRSYILALSLLSVFGTSHAAESDDLIKQGQRYYGQQDYHRALESYVKAAEAGNVEGMERAAVMYSSSRVGKDYQQAVRWYQTAAAQGSVLAMINLGNFYKFGLGVGQDYAQAMQWYQRAAAQDDVRAINHVADMYKSGLGVERDYEQAMTRYLKAADQGDVYAMSNIVEMYQYGLGVEKDGAKAKAWADKIKAAEKLKQIQRQTSAE
jgi:TPR repeat protein